MATIQFYHLISSPLEKALPKLLEKAFAARMNAVVLAESPQQLDVLDQSLWTYHPQSFLPHGSAKDGHKERQPIYLTVDDERPNAPRVLVVTDGRVPEHLPERVLDLFDGQNAESVAAARVRWKAYKDAGHEISYFQQTAQGGWEQKAA